MKTFNIELLNYSKYFGINAEISLNHYYGINKTKLDNIPYDVGSDIELSNKHISVKSQRFSLMSASKCNGYTNFNDIWNWYEKTVKSNTFTYISLTGKCYEMNIQEFKKLVYAFGFLEKESTSNKSKNAKSDIKIRFPRESEKVIKFLENL